MIFTVALMLLACEVTAQEPAPAVARELRVYPLKQPSRVEVPQPKPPPGKLTVRNRWFEDGRNVTTTDGGVLAFSFDFVSDDRPAPDLAPELADLATLFCDPPLDLARERIQSLKDRPGVILAYLQSEQHQWLDRFLDLQANTPHPWTGYVSGEVIALPRGAYHKLGFPAGGLVLEDAAAIQRTREVLVGAGGVVRATPRMTTRPRQVGELSLVTPVYYVSGHEVRVVEPGLVEIVDPVIDFVPEGYEIRSRVVQLSDTRYGVSIDAHATRVERPIPTQLVPVATAIPSQHEIGRPARRTSYHQVSARLADGGGLLIAASGSELDEDLILLLSLRCDRPIPKRDNDF